MGFQPISVTFTGSFSLRLCIPVTVQIPIDSNAHSSDVFVLYYDEASDSWFDGKDVLGWIVPDSTRFVHLDGEAYVEFEINHSGILQLGTPHDSIRADAGVLVTVLLIVLSIGVIRGKKGKMLSGV